MEVLNYHISVLENGKISAQLKSGIRIIPSESASLDLSPLELLIKDYIPLIDASKDHTRERLERVGTLLYQMLFPPAISGHFLELAWRKIEQAPDRYCLTLALTLDVRLQANISSLPWELLYLPRGKTFLGTDPRIAFSRSFSDWLDLPDQFQDAKSKGPLKILMIRWQSEQLEQVALAPIKNYLDDLAKENNLLLPPIVLENPSPSELEDALLNQKPNILHVLTHGQFGDKSTSFAIVGDNGTELRWYGDRSFSDLFHAHRPELIIMQACEGGKTSELESFANGAALLVKRHVPAIVAMRYPITNKVGWIFARRLYKGLTQGERLDFAVQHSRRILAMSNDQLAEDHSSRDFAAPILWVRPECSLLHSTTSQQTNMELADIYHRKSTKEDEDADTQKQRTEIITWNAPLFEELKHNINVHFKHMATFTGYLITADIASIVITTISKYYSEDIALGLASTIIEGDYIKLSNAISQLIHTSGLESTATKNQFAAQLLEDVGIFTITDFSRKLSQLLTSVDIQRSVSYLFESTDILNSCLEYFVETNQRTLIIQCLNELINYPQLTNRNVIQGFRDELGNIPSAEQVARISKKIDAIKNDNNRKTYQIIDYLQVIQTRYQQWKETYIPMKGIQQKSIEISLESCFIDTEFEQIIGSRTGNPSSAKYIPVPDIIQAVCNSRKCILLGEPGAGKTTSLWKLAIDLVERAIEDINAGRQPILPVIIPLGDFARFDDTLYTLIERHAGILSELVDDFIRERRIFLLLDGLNEIPITFYSQRIKEISEFISINDVNMVVTSRILDYRHDLPLSEIKILPLNPLQIYKFCGTALRHYPEQAKELFWSIAGQESEDYWIQFENAEGNLEEFWLSNELPIHIDDVLWMQYGLWKKWLSCRNNPTVLMVLACNPFMLTMLAQVFVRAGSYIPNNKAELFDSFITRLLEQQKARCLQRKEVWIPEALIRSALSFVAYRMQSEAGTGTTLDRQYFEEIVSQALPQDIDISHFLYLSAGANILSFENNSLRFTHQLIQEYFAAQELNKKIISGHKPDLFFAVDKWWQASTWDETFILLTGSIGNPNTIVSWLMESNPILAARCIRESGVELKFDKITKQNVRQSLITQLHNKKLESKVRAQVGQALNMIGDLRNGVLDFDWKRDTIEIPGGEFTIGSGGQSSTLFVDTFRIARYPVTNAIYKKFIEDGGYLSNEWWIPEDSGFWLKFIEGPAKYPSPFDLDNNSVVGVSWFEAMAFCAWLTNKLRTKLPIEWEFRLPTEIEWEKAARGSKSFQYPWGDDFDLNKLNAIENIGTTIAIGTYIEGASPFGVLDMSGNVWEWCLSAFMPYPYKPNDGRESILGGIERARVVRGGSWYDTKENAMSIARHRNDPNIRFDDWGFRICCGKRIQT